MPATYSKVVAKQLNSIEATFKIIATSKGINTSQPIKEIVDELDRLDNEGKLEKCKLHGDLQSYDILRNE